MKSNYVPFGEKWEKEMMRLTKKEIVAMLRLELLKRLAFNRG